MSETRQGYSSKVVLTMADEDGLIISRITSEWFGGQGEEGRLLHNMLQTQLAGAVNEKILQMALAKAKSAGIDVGQLENL